MLRRLTRRDTGDSAALRCERAVQCITRRNLLETRLKRMEADQKRLQALEDEARRTGKAAEAGPFEQKRMRHEVALLAARIELSRAEEEADTVKEANRREIRAEHWESMEQLRYARASLEEKKARYDGGVLSVWVLPVLFVFLLTIILLIAAIASH